MFDTPDGKKTLAELFDSRSQLIVYHFMLGPGWEEGCPSCSFLADHFDGANIHLAQRDVTFVAIPGRRSPRSKPSSAAWAGTFPWVSSFANDFNFDFHVSFADDAVGKDGDYNYERQKIVSDEMPGASVFYKDETGTVFHTYSAYARGLDILVGAYNFLDLTPKGRDEAELPWTMAWVRHHDRYESAKPSHSSCAGAAE